MVIAGSTDPESYFKKLKEEGVIKNNICGTIWKEGGLFFFFLFSSLNNFKFFVLFFLLKKIDKAYKCATCELDPAW